MINISTLKNYDPSLSANVSEMILVNAELKIISTGHSELGLKVPKWVIEKNNLIDAEIARTTSGELKRKLETAKLRREGLRTPDEKRSALEAEIADLENRLNSNETIPTI